MKQHITVEQWCELDFDKQLKLVEWCDSHDYKIGSKKRILSIGQMIEFLENKYWEEEFNDLSIYPSFCDDELDIPECITGWNVGKHNSYELCDALWEAVKEVLND